MLWNGEVLDSQRKIEILGSSPIHHLPEMKLNGLPKHGYFSWIQISRLCHQDFTPGCDFHDLDKYAFIPVSWCNFRGKVIFLIKAKLKKKIETSPTTGNFNV